MALPDAVAQTVAEVATAFTGVVTVDGSQGREFELASGLANRALEVPMRVTTRFGVASGSKTYTAIIILRLAERGMLSLTEPVRTWLGDDLPLVAPEVTLEHLLTHTSGIGDYLDEEILELEDYVLSVPVHTLVTSEDFVPVIDGFPQREEPGTAFRYNNGGLVVASIIAERVTGQSYAELVDAEVVEPAGLTGTGVLRLDTLPGDAAMGYVLSAGDQVNVLHLPVVATGDGGAFTTADDSLRLWNALVGGALVSPEHLASMTRPRNYSDEEDMRYGLGMWLHATGPALIMEGCDIGQSYRSWHDPSTGLTATVLSNTADGVWPMVRALSPLFGG